MSAPRSRAYSVNPKAETQQVTHILWSCACISLSASVGSWGGELHLLSLDAGSGPLSTGKPSSLAGIKTNMTDREWSHSDGMERCRTWGCHWKSTSSAVPCNDCLAQQSVQSDGMCLVETCCPALSLPATPVAFFFPLRNYINRWLSLILIHLFQHLHRASVEGKKKKPNFCSFKKRFSWIFELNSKTMKRWISLPRMHKSFICIPVGCHSTEMSLTGGWFGVGEGNECILQSWSCLDPNNNSNKKRVRKF